MDDPISDTSTPNKRRRLNKGSKTWDSDDDSGEDFVAEDFETVATVPQQRRQLQYTADQLHSDLSSRPQNNNASSSYITQPTQPLQRDSSTVLVDRSSPTSPAPDPIRKSQISRPTGILAGMMAPPGTSFRRPAQPAPIEIASDDDDDDPPVQYSSDEETQGTSLKPTSFTVGGRAHQDSTARANPNPSVQESPQQQGYFASLIQEFKHKESKPADDMISAYGSSSRAPRPQQVPRAKPATSKVYRSVEDVEDLAQRRKVRKILEVYPHESVQRCMQALSQRRGNAEDAMDWLAEQDAPGGDDDVDELSSTVPGVRRGVAMPKSMSQTQSSQPVRPAAKQEVKASHQTIAERYRGSTQVIRRPSQFDEEEEVKPRRRLKQGRKARSPSPLSSPPQKQPQPLQQQQKKKPDVVILDDDSEADAGQDDVQEEEDSESGFDQRLLRFFNECSVRDLTDLSAQPQETVEAFLEHRPFQTLDVVRATSTAPATTKSGKKSRTKPVGDKMVDICSRMFEGYDAIDNLVEECEQIAKPIQDALKGWGLATSNSGEGELHLMNLEEAHDSGIGTPSSSPSPGREGFKANRGKFLKQPQSMSEDVTLKDYQLVALNWLNLLWSKGLSCILADDMGLGKTCQVISFLAHLQQQKIDGVHLVIVPGSTLENWMREFGRFAPSLNVVPYYGSQAERPSLQAQIEEDFATIDVIVTTYDMAVKKDDNYFLRKRVQPAVCIYDEAHALRNPNSDRYKQLTRIPADFRILLTGTPLQNNLQELVAILAFIMPELFAEKREELEYIFQHKASTKDADHAALLSAQRIARARSMMTPFILRRKKAQVLDLPAKNSRVEYCDMTASQSKYYSKIFEEAQQLFNADKAAKKASAKQTSNILMSLRKAANHPLLSRTLYDDKQIDKMVDVLLKHDEFAGNERERVRDYIIGEHHQSFKGGDYGIHSFCNSDVRPYMRKFALKKNAWMDSGKITVFRQLVDAFVQKGDRILVFSQFTTMMNILEAVLETMGVKFMRLDGSTNMQIRQETIDTFTDDESIPVFMLSTKAGGAGINLACANKVIIFDSGFNPQDDIQAENRAHRVGQTRAVEVVRLVTRGTIEEQIHALGESKLALDERVAGEAQAEKAGEDMVEVMFREKVKGEEEGGGDTKDAFKKGLEAAGLTVASKQAQY